MFAKNESGGGVLVDFYSIRLMLIIPRYKMNLFVESHKKNSFWKKPGKKYQFSEVLGQMSLEMKS